MYISCLYISYISCVCLCISCGVWCRVVRGMDVVLLIEKAKTDKNDKPFEDIKIVNMTLMDQVSDR